MTTPSRRTLTMTFKVPSSEQRMRGHNMVRVRDIAGTEVFRNKRTGREYVVVYSKKGKQRVMPI